MAKTYEIEVIAQPSIYQEKERTMKMCFAEPEEGVNEDTGILLLFAGYAGKCDSNIFQKMRCEFADAYNLLTVQCDYFGYEYMQSDDSVEITPDEIERVLTDAEKELLMLNYDKYCHILKGKLFQQIVQLNETPESFNDMGLMQAMDNLRAVKILLDIVKENNYQINQNRIYGYGFSHGAYLEYLCNAFWPGLFTAFVDNSSYIMPFYYDKGRMIRKTVDGFVTKQLYPYKAEEFVNDADILNLEKLYQYVENQAEIICYAGETDDMTTLEQKKNFLNQVNHSHVETITKSRVDMIRFKTTDYGLGADFIELFHYAYLSYLQPKEEERKKSRKSENHEITFSNFSYDSKKYHYEICWEDGMPILHRTNQK